jgi:hypothetical protein
MNDSESIKLKEIVKKVTGKDDDSFIDRLDFFKSFLTKKLSVFSTEEIVKIYRNLSVFKKIFDWVEVDEFVNVLYLLDKEKHVKDNK